MELVKRKKLTKTIAYLRVSTDRQELDKNKADILHVANEKDFGQVTFVEETASGTKRWRERKIKEVIDTLTDGDRLIVSELSRLGRSMLEIMEMLSVLKEKGVNVYAVKGSWELNGSLQSKVMAMAFSIAAEIERDLISSRTKEALRARKAMGMKLGRPKGPGKSKLDEHREEIVALLQNGSAKAFVARRYNTSVPNLYNWLQKNCLDVSTTL
ncbi:recombinase family protein [Thermodesulfobacteriota bacterium]